MGVQSMKIALWRLFWTLISQKHLRSLLLVQMAALRFQPLRMPTSVGSIIGPSSLQKNAHQQAFFADDTSLAGHNRRLRYILLHLQRHVDVMTTLRFIIVCYRALRPVERSQPPGLVVRGLWHRGCPAMVLRKPVFLPDIGHCILILGTGPLMMMEAGCALASLPLTEIAIAFATFAVVVSIKLGKCGS